jgi:hypothetical protein
MKKEVISIVIFSFFLFACVQKITHPSSPRSESTPETQPSAHPSVPDILRSGPPESDIPFARSDRDQKSGTDIRDEDEITGESKPGDIIAKALRPGEAESPPGSLPAAPAQTEAPATSISLPDIALSKLWLTPQRKLAVLITNIGDAPLPTEVANLKIFVDGQLKGHYNLKNIADQSSLPPGLSVAFTTPLTIVGRHEVHGSVEIDQRIREKDGANNRLRKTLESAPIGPDILIKDLDLTEDLDLFIVLSNGGEGELRKGTTLRIRIDLNDRKVSEFDHFIAEPLKANLGNQYVIDPPYSVRISGISRVKVSISPKSPSDDIRLINNTLKRNFVLFPFKIKAQGRKEFSFAVHPPRLKDGGSGKRVKAELRWEGGGAPLMLSLRGISPITGRSPLKAEVPVALDLSQKKIWKAAVTSFLERNVEGYLIIQHP